MLATPCARRPLIRDVRPAATSLPDMRNRLNTLFYTFLVIFALTSIVTLLGVTGLVTIAPTQLNALLGAFLLELAGAVVTLFRSAPFFGATTDLATSLAGSIAVIDDVTDEIDAVVHGRAQARTNRQYGIVVRRERGALVAYQRMQVIKGEDLQKLPPEQRDALEAYETSMTRFHDAWKSVWARRSAAKTLQERESIDTELQRLVQGMQEDLHGILDFFGSQGMVLDDHYRHVRVLVDDLAAGRKQQDYEAPLSTTEA